MTSHRSMTADEGNVDFEEFQKQKPGAKFSDYYVAKLRDMIEEGQSHGALGKTLSRQGVEVDFEEAGRKEFENYQRWFDLTPTHRVIDYGCGSLRVGLHFIRFLAPAHYFGLDLTPDFFQAGLIVLDERLDPGWQAEIGTISDRLDDAVEFSADFVFSSNVAYHVHPAERDDFCANLRRLAGKPGARLCFDARVAIEPHRFGDRNWADHYDLWSEKLPEFQLARTFPDRETVQRMLGDQPVVRVIFDFERRSDRR